MRIERFMRQRKEGEQREEDPDRGRVGFVPPFSREDSLHDGTPTDVLGRSEGREKGRVRNPAG